MRFILVPLFALFFGSAIGQNFHAHRFIEPNVYFDFDSTMLIQKDRYTNPTPGTETYGFSYYNAGRAKSYLQISTGPAVPNADLKYQDSVSNAILNQARRFVGDSMIVKTSKPFSYKGFSGYGYVLMHKKKKEYTIEFAGTKYFGDGLCKVYYTSLCSWPIDSVGTDYPIITGVIDGITTYGQKEFEAEQSTLSKKYTIVVDSIAKPDGYSPLATYFGIVRVKQKVDGDMQIQNVDMGYQTFFPDYRKNIIIYCIDNDKGKIVKKGELVVTNKLGKEMRLPFSFTYVNK